MKKIQIDEYRPIQYFAAFKARVDSRKFFSELGFKEYNFEPYVETRSKILNFIIFFKSVVRIILTLLCNRCVVIMQYPIPALYKYKNFIYKIIFFMFRGKLIIYVHDLEHIRNKYSIYKDKDLIYLLEKTDFIILHTENMKNKLLNEFEMDVNKIRILGPFDYSCNDNIKIDTTIKGEKVIFAGNLNKSEFINELGQLNNISFNLYGVIDKSKVLSNNCLYKGFFNPNQISSIEGDWGLVWDGDSIDGCSGHLGEYLKYNSSHKFSLYIAAGFPVIVWSKSGLSKYVKDNKIGITIDKLSDLNNIFKSISEEEKKEIKMNVTILSSKIRNGYNTKKIISEILKSIEQEEHDNNHYTNL